MSGVYRKDVEWSVISGIDIEDSDNEKEYIPADTVKDTLDNIESNLGDIIYKLKDVEGLDLIDEVKSDLEELFNKIY